MKISIDTDELIIKSLLNISDGMMVDIPPALQTNIRNLIMAVARNELIIVECTFKDNPASIWVLCAHITDNPAAGEKLLPICMIPPHNAWLADLRPPPGVPKSAFVTPLPAEPFQMVPVDMPTEVEFEPDAASMADTEEAEDDEHPEGKRTIN